MRCLVDENLSALAIAFLRASACDVKAIAECASGSPDDAVVDLARNEKRVLFSFDRDHGDLIFNQGVLPPPAVVYLRLFPVSPEDTLLVLQRVLALGERALYGHFTVVTRDGLRQRPLPLSLRSRQLDRQSWSSYDSLEGPTDF